MRVGFANNRKLVTITHGEQWLALTRPEAAHLLIALDRLIGEKPPADPKAWDVCGAQPFRPADPDREQYCSKCTSAYPEECCRQCPYTAAEGK